MKHHSRLIFLISLLATSGMLGCDNDSDSGNSETTPNCQITQTDCDSQGKTFDDANCICVDSGSPQVNCSLTEDLCAAANKILDVQNCICIVPGTPQNCQITQADCEKMGKSFDAEKCICNDIEIPPDCQITQDDCDKLGKSFDADKCICIDTEIPPDCQITQDDCEKLGKSFDAEKCICTQNCANVRDGQTTCGDDHKLMVCHDGRLEEAIPGCGLNETCRDGESECSPYQDCGTIAHDTQGCLDKNIVTCSDGVLTTITDCSSKEQFCSSDEQLGFICKFPEPTDCLWHETLIPQGQTICDGNVLKTCSATVETEFDEGTDCAALDPATPICNPNACRAEKGCGDNGDITPGDIVCNDDGTNKAKCIDGNLVELTGENACTARENATPVCTYSTEAVCSDTCNPGFTDVNGTCEKTKTCIDNKEIYLESTNTCACNTEAHYAGMPNACQCEPGYFERTDHCEAGCLYANAEYHYGDSTCSSEGKVLTCQPDGTMSEDTCEKGVCIGGKCEIQDCGDLHDGEYQCISNSLMMCSDGTLTAADTPCTSEQLCLDGAHACVDKKSCTATGTMLDTATNTCICNTTAHWEGTAGACKCTTGYVEIDGACVEKKTCDAVKETYDSSTNTCSCNTAAHWDGTAGSCTCATGYVQVGNVCELKKSCDNTKEIYNSSTNTCSCNTAAHWDATAGSCTCATGYVEIGGVCVEKKTCDAVKEIYNSSTNTCSCNTAAHWTGTAGSCECATDYVEIGGVCELKKTCNSNEKYNEATNSCACDYSRHFVGSVGACRCENGYVEIDGVCELKKSCDAVKETYNSATNTCSCNSSAHWTGTAGSCTCETNYVEIGGGCELKKTCNSVKETYNSATNTCSCNTAAHWAGTAGSCQCANGYVQIGNTCELKNTCNDNETYDETTNSCACDYDKHFVGAAGACTCENGYVQVGSVCELPVTCDAIRETYNSTTNTCSCNTAAHWAGTAGSCECAIGFYQDGNTCNPDDAEHCRGVDCTAVSYWGDGICTESGQCQVTSCIGDTHLYDNGTNTTCEANTASHCGDHNTDCGEGGACVDGSCGCMDGLQRCDGACINTQTDIDNCGTCGNACGYGLECISGKCLGYVNCNGTSHNTATDIDHCGECNHRCSDGTTCTAGECLVAEGPTYCGDQTVQLNTPEHCESCAPCADGLICQNNQCTSGQGPMICGGIVIDSRSDSANCGSCGNVCNAGLECVNSACKRITSLSESTTITCNAQTVKPYSDKNNCAGCGIACSVGNKCKAGACVPFDVGDTITFGSYEQDNNTSNGKEPIEWRVLNKKSNNQFLLISEKVLDAKPYNTTYIGITWEKSTIRSWLNGYGASYNTVGTSFTNNNFINTAFTATERAKIVSSNVPASVNPYFSSISPGNATTDKIFLLSITDANSYFSSDIDRRADATRYAVKQGLRVYGSESGKSTSDGTCTDVHCYAFWWLRSPGSSTRNAASVGTNGSIVYGSDSVDHDYGVRPALWVQFGGQ